MYAIENRENPPTFDDLRSRRQALRDRRDPSLRRRPILSMLFRCAIAIGLGLPLSLYPGSLLQSDGTPGKFLNQFPLSCCRNMQLKKRKASILVLVKH